MRHIYKYLRFPLYRKGLQDAEGVETVGHRLPRLRTLFPGLISTPEQVNALAQHLRACLDIIDEER